MTTITRGDTELFDIAVIDPRTLEPYPLHGCTVMVTVKAVTVVPDTEALYQHWITLDANGVVTASKGITLGPGGAAAGVVIQELTPTESSRLATGDYIYDVQVTMADNRIETPINGDVETVVPDVTHAITRPGATP